MHRYTVYSRFSFRFSAGMSCPCRITRTNRSITYCRISSRLVVCSTSANVAASAEYGIGAPAFQPLVLPPGARPEASEPASATLASCSTCASYSASPASSASSRSSSPWTRARFAGGSSRVRIIVLLSAASRARATHSSDGCSAARALGRVDAMAGDATRRASLWQACT